MGRIKGRIALFLAAAAVSGVFFTASPVAAQESCYPYPVQYCNTMNWFARCVVLALHGYNDPWCQS